jgi:hypothetical protein
MNSNSNNYKSTNYKLNLQGSAEISELHSAMQKLYANQEYDEIIKLLLETIRIRLIVISEVIMNQSVPTIKMDKASVLLKKLSGIVFDSTGFNLMAKFITPLTAIEEKVTEKNQYTGKNRNGASNVPNDSVFSKTIFRKDVLFLIDLYYMLKTFNPKCLFGNEGIKSDEAVDWFEKIKGIDTRFVEALPESLKFISPIATYIKNNTHKKIPFAKALPFVKNKQQSAIPESVGPVLKDFVETKFREEIDATEHEFDKTSNLNSTISKIHFLESTRKTLSKNLEIAMPRDKMRRTEYSGIQRFLQIIMILCLGIIFLNILQIVMLPAGTMTFLTLTIIPVAIIGIGWVLQKKTL